jgi:hypothetical protein
MITAAIVSREGLLGWLSGKEPDGEIIPLDLGLMKSKLRKGICGILAEREDLFQGTGKAIIVVPGAELRDFFAFVSTYVSDYVPFSAYYRVVALERLGQLLNMDLPELKGRRFVPEPLIGICIAEAFQRLNGQASSVDDVPLAAVSRTLSYVLAGSLNSGLGGKDLSEIVARWKMTKTLFSGSESDETESAALTIFRCLSASLTRAGSEREDEFISGVGLVIANVGGRGSVSMEDWSFLCRSAPQLLDVYPTMRGPREDRIRGFFSAIDLISKFASNADKRNAECLAGCLLALVGDGSYQYLSLTREFQANLENATLWFGLWASLFKSSDVLTIGNCLGRRSARDCFVRSSLFSAPIDDLSFEELNVLPSTFPLRFHYAQQNVLSVEIMPNVAAKFRIGKSPQQQPALAEIKEASEDVKELRFLLERVDQVAERLSIGLGIKDAGGSHRSSRLKRKSH